MGLLEDIIINANRSRVVLLAALLVPPAASAQQAQRQDLARYCTHCATVVSVTVDGAAAGQVGSSGQAAGGASTGARKFVLLLRYADGRKQSMVFDNDPGFREGDKVRVRDGVLSREP